MKQKVTVLSIIILYFFMLPSDSFCNGGADNKNRSSTVSNADGNASYQIVNYVIGSGGIIGASNANYLHSATVGQTFGGEMSGQNNVLLSGFWHSIISYATGGVSLAMTFSPGWSWISFNVQPPDLAIDQVMAGMTHLVIVVNGAGQFYIPGVINNIGNLEVTQGYKVYCSGADELSFQGSQVQKATPIQLTAGWNFVAYLPDSAVNVQTALASVLSNLAIAKDDAGNFFIPAVINTLGDMKPKKGYKLYMKNGATLIYP